MTAGFLACARRVELSASTLRMLNESCLKRAMPIMVANAVGQNATPEVRATVMDIKSRGWEALLLWVAIQRLLHKEAGNGGFE